MHALQAKSMPLKNALLSDVCISTSAAPTYLPAHYFQIKDANGKAREYNLIDGGVAANNPVSSNRNPSDIQNFRCVWEVDFCHLRGHPLSHPPFNLSAFTSRSVHEYFGKSTDH